MTSRGQKMWNAKLSADVDVYQRRSISCICTYICCWNRMLTFSCSLANGHIMLNTPVLVRSLKLSNIEPSQYLDGWPPGNTGCCWLSKTFCKVSQFWFLCSALVDINNLVKRLERFPNASIFVTLTGKEPRVYFYYCQELWVLPQGKLDK